MLNLPPSSRRIHVCQTSEASKGARRVPRIKSSRQPCVRRTSAAARRAGRGLTFLFGLRRREFIFSNYAELKKANPLLPILVRECSGVEAKLVARYGAPSI